MIAELIYTSARRGLRPRGSGFQTVAHTRGLPAPVIETVERLSAYRFLFSPSGPEGERNPVIRNHAIAIIGGQRFHVISRIAPSGADYSGRANHLAHHLILSPDALPAAGPPWLLAQEHEFQRVWPEEPMLLTPRDGLPDAELFPTPCKSWQQATGDPGWAGEVIRQLRLDPTRPLFLIYEPGMDMLRLMAELCLLLHPSERWRVTFSTALTGPPPPGIQCQIRCVPDIRAARQAAAIVPGNFVLNLSASSLGPCPDSPEAQAARAGLLIPPGASHSVAPTTPASGQQAPTHERRFAESRSETAAASVGVLSPALSGEGGSSLGFELEHEPPRKHDRAQRDAFEVNEIRGVRNRRPLSPFWLAAMVLGILGIGIAAGLWISDARYGQRNDTEILADDRSATADTAELVQPEETIANGQGMSIHDRTDLESEITRLKNDLQKSKAETARARQEFDSERKMRQGLESQLAALSNPAPEAVEWEVSTHPLTDDQRQQMILKEFKNSGVLRLDKTWVHESGETKFVRFHTIGGSSEESGRKDRLEWGGTFSAHWQPYQGLEITGSSEARMYDGLVILHPDNKQACYLRSPSTVVASSASQQDDQFMSAHLQLHREQSNLVSIKFWDSANRVRTIRDLSGWTSVSRSESSQEFRHPNRGVVLRFNHNQEPRISLGSEPDLHASLLRVNQAKIGAWQEQIATAQKQLPPLEGDLSEDSVKLTREVAETLRAVAEELSTLIAGIDHGARLRSLFEPGDGVLGIFDENGKLVIRLEWPEWNQTIELESPGDE